MLELSDSFAPSGFPSQFFRLKSWFKYFKKNMITFILTSANLSCHQVSSDPLSKESKQMLPYFCLFFELQNYHSLF